MLLRQARVHRLPMDAPDDVSALAALIDGGALDPAHIVAILGKTEGNGCVNDFTRGFAVASLRALLSPHLAPEALDAVAMVMSGGCEGAVAPHLLVFEALPAEGQGGAPALALGRATTRDLAPVEVGRSAQTALAAEAVRAAMADAGIAAAADVHFVQVKCPLLGAAQIAAAAAPLATADTLKSMGLSRGAAALGVAVALGEATEIAAAAALAAGDMGVYSARASCSAGSELRGMEILVIGESPRWTGPLRVGHAVMADGLDVAPVRALLRRLGADGEGPLTAPQSERLEALLVKAEPSRSGRLRGWRHTMLDDSDVSATRHARALVGGALGALAGHGALFVSGGAEHQGPDGGGPCAVIWRA